MQYFLFILLFIYLFYVILRKASQAQDNYQIITWFTKKIHKLIQH